VRSVVFFAAVAILAGCDRGEEDAKARKELADKLDDVGGEARKSTERVDALEKKVDALTAKLDAMTAAQQAAAARPAAPPAYQRRPEPDPADVYAVPVDGDPAEGPANALVTIVEGSDYACPYCAKVRDTLAALRQKYGDDLRVVHKSFVVHPQIATTAALAACAAQHQKKWAKLDALLWDEGFVQRKFDDAAIRDFAKRAGLDLDRYDRDLVSCHDEIARDQTELQTVGQGATPTFFINGHYMSGAQPEDAFAQVIDAELAKAQASGIARDQYYEIAVLERGKPKFNPNGP
jgi:protein-disulfide isomerase